jgi:hypothetical protein
MAQELHQGLVLGSRLDFGPQVTILEGMYMSQLLIEQISPQKISNSFFSQIR